MSNETIRLKHLRTHEFHNVTPAAWKALQENGKADHYKEMTAPPIPKEVADKANDKKLAGSQTPASDKHESQTNSDRLPVKDAG